MLDPNVANIPPNVWRFQKLVVFLPMSTRRERAKAQNQPFGLFIAFTSFGVGLVLTDKKKED